MGNTNLPTPVVIAGGAFCLLAGYLLGVVSGPDTPDRTTGVIMSYDNSSNRLCLTGETVAEHEGADEEGVLCGSWRRSAGSQIPREGDDFRFVSVLMEAPSEGERSAEAPRIFIYGDVVG